MGEGGREGGRESKENVKYVLPTPESKRTNELSNVYNYYTYTCTQYVRTLAGWYISQITGLLVSQLTGWLVQVN